tara:strand:+ start:1820 stop:2743 length:924 start_codon:yes stop_codon:yes gene_type:complete
LRNLVTGGAGFIGSHLIKQLLKEGQEVICIDNFFSGKEFNVKQFSDNSNYKFIFHDVVDPIELNVERIWHLACPASPIFYQANPIKTAKTSFIGTLNMLGLAKRLNAKILFASTSEVYGDAKITPQNESYRGSVNPIGIRSCYDEGKRIGESLCFDYYRSHQVSIKVARIFNTYGPGMTINDGRVVSNFIVQALSGKNITIYGNGSQTRSFCYVNDTVKGLIALMNSEEKGPVNIGNDHEIAIKELASLIQNKIEKKTNIVFKPLPEDDPVQRKPCIKKARKILDWSPNIDINYGLDKTIAYFKKIL